MELGMWDLQTISSILQFPVRDLVRWLAAYEHETAKEERRKRIGRRIQGAIEILSGGLAAELLQQYYNDEDLSKSGLGAFRFLVNGQEVSVPVVTMEDWINLRTPIFPGTVESHLLEETPDVLGASPQEAAAVLLDIEARGIRIWNAPIYRLLDLNTSRGEMSVNFCIDEFFRYRFTIGSLLDELIQSLIDKDFRVAEVIRKRDELLPLRMKYLPDAAALLRWRERICAGGVGVVVAFARGVPHNDFAIPIQRRSESVSNNPRMLTVSPMGFHQPSISPKDEVYLSHSVFREFFEELFGGSEAETRGKRIAHDWFMSEHPALAWFLLAQPEQFWMECCGMCINMGMGEYNFAVLIAISDEDYWKQFSHLLMVNWEVLDETNQLLPEKRLVSTRTRIKWRNSCGERIGKEKVTFHLRKP